MNNEKDLVTKVTMSIRYKQNDCLGENMICCILKSETIFFSDGPYEKDIQIWKNWM